MIQASCHVMDINLFHPVTRRDVALSNCWLVLEILMVNDLNIGEVGLLHDFHPYGHP